jgi:hypothetical protein
MQWLRHFDNPHFFERVIEFVATVTADAVSASLDRYRPADVVVMAPEHEVV